MPLTKEWSYEGYRELAAAAVADGFKIALRAKKTLYALDHEDESINTRRLVWNLHKRAKWKKSASEFSIESYRMSCERELSEVIRFTRSPFFSLYTNIEPEWFWKELDKRLMEWVYEEERKMESESNKRKEGRR